MLISELWNNRRQRLTRAVQYLLPPTHRSTPDDSSCSMRLESEAHKLQVVSHRMRSKRSVAKVCSVCDEDGWTSGSVRRSDIQRSLQWSNWSFELPGFGLSIASWTIKQFHSCSSLAESYKWQDRHLLIFHMKLPTASSYICVIARVHY